MIHYGSGTDMNRQSYDQARNQVERKNPTCAYILFLKDPGQTLKAFSDPASLQKH